MTQIEHRRGARVLRRKDKEITDIVEIEGILEEARVCRLALCGEDGPYMVPLNFGYRCGQIYIHSAAEGKKIDLMRKDDRVCFEVETKVEISPGESPCKWSMRYRSVIGYGKAYFLEGAEEKREALGIIFGHYSSAAFEVPGSACEKLAVIRIQINSMTAKASC
ncbi:MAG: pyridoxamine 5'-phosphate oxidase family protein [Syntrophobacteraceae bacterium]